MALKEAEEHVIKCREQLDEAEKMEKHYEKLVANEAKRNSDGKV